MKNFKTSRILLSCVLFLALSCKNEDIKKAQVKPVDNNLKLAAEPKLPEGGGGYMGLVQSALESGRVIDIEGSSEDEGALVQQMDWMSLRSQKWTARLVSDGFYKIINLGSQKVLTSPDNVAGAQLIQAAYTGSESQLWKITVSGPGGLYRVVNKAGLAVSLNNPENGNGAIITQETISNGTEQAWYIRRLFGNPLKAGVADPWVTQRNGMYYFTATTGWNITLYKTRRMSELKNAKAVIAWIPPSGQMYSSNIWAPELHYLDGKWYVYFAGDNGNDGNHRMHVLENPAEDPTTGTWTYKGKIGDESDIWAIDGSILEFGGKRYFMWSGWRFQNGSQSGIQQIYIAEMSNPWTITGERYMISEPTYDWEKVGLVNEGPEMLKNEAGDIFLIYSASGCWTDEYKLGMMKLTGTDPLLQASWTKSETPVFVKSIANSVYSPGHNSFFKSPNGAEDWIIYHANKSAGQGCGGTRSTRMQKFTWNVDGTPNFGIPKAITESLTVPAGEGL